MPDPSTLPVAQTALSIGIPNAFSTVQSIKAVRIATWRGLYKGDNAPTKRPPVAEWLRRVAVIVWRVYLLQKESQTSLVATRPFADDI